jgi:hypothetical protein
VPGIIDYVFTVPPRSSARKRATDHMLSNVSALMLFAAARARRRADGSPPSWWRVATGRRRLHDRGRMDGNYVRRAGPFRPGRARDDLQGRPLRATGYGHF